MGYRSKAELKDKKFYQLCLGAVRVFPLSPSARPSQKKWLKGAGQKKILLLSSSDLKLIQGSFIHFYIT